MPNKIVQKGSAVVSLFLIMGFVILCILVHLTNPSLNAMRFPLSCYRYAPQGYLLIAGLIMIALAEWVLGMLFFLTNKVWNNWLAGYMGIMGLSAFLTGIFPMDIPPEHSVHGGIHIYAAIVQFVLFPVSILLYGKGISKPIARLLCFGSGIFVVVLLLFIAYIVFTENPVLLNYYGLLQKLYIVLITVWLMVPASRFIVSDKLD